MNRIERVRQYVDDILLNMEDTEERRCAYLHLYGVSQACVLIALKRNGNTELAAIAGMLHDISSYATMDSFDHANKSALITRDILQEIKQFEENEIEQICSAVHRHSDKNTIHSDFDEILTDADTLQHWLYNPLFDVAEHEKGRVEKLKTEFCL